MSIIFQKLKDIADESLQDDSMEGRPFRQRKIYTLKKGMLSSAGLLIPASAIGSFAVIIFFTLFFLKKNMDSGAGCAIFGEKPQVQHSLNTILPPDTIMPNAENMGPAPAGGTVPDIVPPVFFLKHKIKRAQTMPVIKPVAAIKKENPVVIRHHKEIPAERKKGRKKDRKKDRKKVTLKKNKAGADIETLATDLDDAFRQGNNLKTDRLLTKIIHLILFKTNKSNYYLKLMAFKEIREARYDSAKKFLNQVLAKDKNDFEAGINMAVIEIRKHQYTAAKKRLTRLRELYPSNSKIDTLLDKLLNQDSSKGE